MGDEKAQVPFALGAVYRRDVRRIERREKPRLALEPRETLRVLREVLGKDLDRHFAPEPRVFGAIHLPHATAPEWRQDRVVPEPRPGRD
ncbi:MAG TPA: hypothetical protein VIE88_06650 [Vicinamibacteria bacterium]|jgi:hypothetical protein